MFQNQKVIKFSIIIKYFDASKWLVQSNSPTPTWTAITTTLMKLFDHPSSHFRFWHLRCLYWFCFVVNNYDCRFLRALITYEFMNEFMKLCKHEWRNQTWKFVTLAIVRTQHSIFNTISWLWFRSKFAYPHDNISESLIHIQNGHLTQNSFFHWISFSDSTVVNLPVLLTMLVLERLTMFVRGKNYMIKLEISRWWICLVSVQTARTFNLQILICYQQLLFEKN